MGSFEDDDDREDSLEFETQQIDSQYSDGDFDDDEIDDFRFLTNTMPVDDNSYLLDDAFETQFMNLAGETQAVDLDDETQVLDELDCMENTHNEFVNEPCTENVGFSVCEDANKTEAFCETQVLYQEDDCVKVDDVGLVGPENTKENCRARQDTFPGGFTAIRTASMRASGLAALKRGSSLNPCPTSSEKSSVEQETSNKDDECLQNECIEDIEDPENLNKCKIPPSVVERELYHDDEIDQFEITDPDDNNPDITSGNCLAGLSYVDSQEPGALSQANALEVVDKFLDLNVMDYEERFGREVKNVEKTKVGVPSVKGSRELAKKSCGVKNAEGKIGAYDWDDNREDDCGGEFFLKKKELFFDQPNPKGLTEPRVKAVARNNGDKTEQKWSKNKGSAYSDLGRMSCKMRANVKSSLNCGEKEKLLKKNLMKEFNRQVNVGPVPNLVENEITTNFMDTKDDTVGPDTQMAAEAMETLCFEVQLGDNNNDDNAPLKAEATGKNQSAKERNHDTCVGVVTRQAKQQQKSINESPLLSRNLGLSISGYRGTKSTGQRREKKPHLEDHLDFYVPVAHRTRKGTGLHLSKELAKPFDNRVTRKSATALDKTVGSSGPTASNTDTINSRKEKRPRQGNLVQADPQYSNGMLKRSRKVGVNSLGTQSGKNLLRQNAECGKGDTMEKAKADGRLEASTPPASFRTPLNNASPICKGDEYHKQSCRKNLSRLSLIMEIDNLVTGSPGPFGGTKESRKRKDITSIRVLFSQHLDEDVVKHQKKILAKLGGAVATFMSDATHFVADEFVRTRNMLEAIAFGKPVVSHLWLESCGQASCLIDEKNYILRDSKKEKEFGFCLPASLSRACQHPLLQGQKVLVTPNTKPGKDILANLVKAVHGLAIERVGRSVLKDEKLPDDLLILSCEDDYELCVPFLEKGGAIYSSELLLNGIVKQKLEYERHRLFEDHVKKTRSTTWMKTKSVYHPATKRK